MKQIVAGKTVGLDLGDRYSYYVVLDSGGEVESEGRVATKKGDLQRQFRELPECRMVVEVGTHSGWVSRHLMKMGHEVLVANPRQLPLIYQNRKKTDRTDAELLARIGRADPKLLQPIRHRQLEGQQDLVVLRSRDNLVRARCSLVNAVRGDLKQFGIRVPRCSTAGFAKRAGKRIPEELMAAVGPMVSMIAQLTSQIRAMDKKIHQLCTDKYPETGVLLQIRGVGEITALAFVLCLESPDYFAKNRDAGAYLGLVPRRDQSGDRDLQLGITKAGDAMLRRLLVNCAQYMLGHFGEDCDIRRHGERIAARGGKNARKRAVVAMARKLSVLMLRLWRTGEVYEPLYNAQLQEAAA